MKNADGNVLVSWTSLKSFSSVNISTADMISGESYTLTTGSDSQTFQLTSISTSNGSGKMGGGGGGMNSNRP